MYKLGLTIVTILTAYMSAVSLSNDAFAQAGRPTNDAIHAQVVTGSGQVKQDLKQAVDAYQAIQDSVQQQVNQLKNQALKNIDSLTGNLISDK